MILYMNHKYAPAALEICGFLVDFFCFPPPGRCIYFAPFGTEGGEEKTLI